MEPPPPPRTEADERQFKRELEALIPMMRGFARSLCMNSADADDIAQEALLRAWRARDGFRPGTNLKAWVFTIIRNHFYSTRRTAGRTTSLDPEVAERTLTVVDNPAGRLELDEVRRALSMLPAEQREALILVGAGGMTYEEVAEITGCPIGTIKSRLCRGRAALVGLWEAGAGESDGVPVAEAYDSLIDEARRRSGWRPPEATEPAALAG